MDEDDSIQDLNILNEDDPAFAKQREQAQSKPNKQKVAAFKNRVFGLLMLYVQKSKNLQPLIEGLSQEIFAKQPQKMRQVVNGLINRNGIEGESLVKIAEFYKNMLLFRNKNRNPVFAEDFLKIIRKISSSDVQTAKKIVQQLLEVFLTKRKCNLQTVFFPFLMKRFQQCKPWVLAKILEVEQNVELRPAQAKLLQKMKAKLTKKQKVKEEAIQIEQQEEQK